MSLHPIIDADAMQNAGDPPPPDKRVSGCSPDSGGAGVVLARICREDCPNFCDTWKGSSLHRRNLYGETKNQGRHAAGEADPQQVHTQV